MQFTHPIWLAGIAGILIPILIHLWNVKRGKVLKVGSILLMGESSRQNSRSLRLRDIWLLLLRCLIIIVMSLLLAKPVWPLKESRALKGHILIPPAEFKTAYQYFGSEIDSLLEAGFELREFGPDSVLSYLSLARSHLMRFGNNTETRIYTDNLLRNFEGEPLPKRPGMIWKTFPVPPQNREWISSAWFDLSDSISVVLGRSDSTSVTYQTKRLSRSGTDRDLELRIDKGKAFLGFRKLSPGVDSSLIPVDTSKKRIMIYPGEHPDDAEYVRSALEAIRLYTGRNIEIRNYSKLPDPEQADILFWLSEKALPELAGSRTNTVFKYSTGSSKETRAELVSENLSRSFKPSIPLFRYRADQEKDQGRVLWTDNFGNTILKKQNTGQDRTIFTFHSRFSPAWSGLVWSEEFPELLVPILFPHSTQGAGSNDVRVVEPALIFSEANEAQLSPGNKNETRSFDILIAFLLAALLGFERWFAHLRSTLQNG